MRICIPVRESNLGKAVLQVKLASQHADFVEIWFDKFKSGDEILELIKSSGKPVIAVCRAAAEHGGFKGSEKERIEVLKQTVAAGAHFCDVGIHTDRKFIADLKKTCKKYGAKLIVSLHVWDRTPELEVLLKEVLRARRLGADIVKIATFVKKWSDNVVLFELVKRAEGKVALPRLGLKGKTVIVVGMGKKSLPSRVGCPLLGSYLAYVALDEKSKTAPGQLTIKSIPSFFF